jgi:hypothetical protein
MTTPTNPSGPTSSNDPDQIRREIERTQNSLSQDVNLLGEKVSPGAIAQRRVDRVRGTANRWKDRVMGSDPYSSGGGIHDAAASVSDTAQRAVGTVGDTASSAASNVAEAAQNAPAAVRQQTRGNPVAAGLIAFGVGWLVSSLIPASRAEQQAAEQAKQQAAQLREPLAQVAGEVKDDLAEPAQQAVESVRDHATQAGQNVAQEGRSAAGDVRDQAQQSAQNVRRS